MIGNLLRLAFRLGAIAVVVRWVRHHAGPASGIAQPAAATTTDVGESSPFSGDVNELTCTELFAKLEALAAEWSDDARLAEQAEHAARYRELREAMRTRCSLDATIESKPGDSTVFRAVATPA